MRQPHLIALGIQKGDIKKFGIVGAGALDQYGNIAAGLVILSLSGPALSPTNGSCGISSTGHGEYFIHDIAAQMLSKNV